MAKYTGVEKYIFSDTYNFFLKYQDKPNRDDVWNSIIADAESLYQKYSNCMMIRNMLTAVLNQLELKINGQSGSGQSYEYWERKIGNYLEFEAFK